jgi:hypothetical protein
MYGNAPPVPGRWRRSLRNRPRGPEHHNRRIEGLGVPHRTELKMCNVSWALWPTPIILATWTPEIWSIATQAQKVCKNPSQPIGMNRWNTHHPSGSKKLKIGGSWYQSNKGWRYGSRVEYWRRIPRWQLEGGSRKRAF